MSDEVRPDAIPSEPENPETQATAAEETLAAAAADTEEQAADEEPALIAADVDDAAEAEHIEVQGEAELAPAPKLERLQKILAQAGVSSRRHAENLITEGRVQVNGKVITELGTKADAARDHIRVDGKLLQGSERLRYFMLNKPKGFVTTVSDPEKRPTVMEFFTKLRERLYPVGRLDYLSEGLLVVTNDGDLANKLTRAAAGVEKTYLVKVSGEPSEEALDRLRSGIGIERGKPGSGRVQTAPAQIRKVRQGDNPWYEVVIIEGRNRELRKMFEEIGHHVEKIRRVGYGPLVLDIEPGKMRELEPEELEDLRKAADGKLRKPKLKDIRRRKAMDAQLPTLRPGPGRPPAAPPSVDRPAFSPTRSFRLTSSSDLTGPRARNARKVSSVQGPSALGPVPSGSARRDLAHNVQGRHNLVPGARPGSLRGGRKIATPVRRAPSSVRRSLDRHLRVKIGQLVDLRGVAVLMALAPSRRSHGRSPIPLLVQIVQPSNLTPAPRRDAVPDREEVKAPRPSRLQIEAVEPERESPTRPTASRPPTGRTPAGRPPFRSAGSGRPTAGRAGHSRPGQFRPRTDRPDSDRPRPDRAATDGPDRIRDQIGPGLIALPSTAAAVHTQLAAPAAPALENSAEDGLLALRVIVHAPLPPAPANPVPAAPDHPTNAPAHPRQENRLGNPSPAEQAEPLQEAAAAPSLHLAPGQAVPPDPALATRANLVAPGNQEARDPPANAQAGSLAARSEAKA